MPSFVRRSYIAWMGKSQVCGNPSDGGEMRIEETYVEKGQRKDWQKDDWPPARVRVTVEELIPVIDGGG